MKTAVKNLLGSNLVKVIHSGVCSLSEYPQYLRRSGRAGRLRCLVIELTFRCNASCRMCPLYGEHRDTELRDSLSKRRAELSTSQIQSVVEQSCRMGAMNLMFTGGEPLLRDDLPDLIAFAKQLGMTVGVISNGSLLSDRRAYEITLAGLDWLHISLDGPGEIHNSIRRVPNMFARIDANLSILRAHKQHLKQATPAVTVGCTVSALNQFSLHDLVPIAARWQARLVVRPVFFAFDARIQPVPNAPSSIKPEDWALPEYIRNVDVDQLAAELALVRRLGRQYGADVSVEMGRTARQLREYYFDHSFRANNKCLYPWYATRMNPYGDIYNCSLQTLMGNVLEQPMESIWNSERYVSFRKTLRQHGIFPQCARCCALNADDVVLRVLPRFRWGAPTPSQNKCLPGSATERLWFIKTKRRRVFDAGGASLEGSALHGAVFDRSARPQKRAGEARLPGSGRESPSDPGGG
jgi:radical SAM protein with 4Fe4S-binding SPASM domain